MSIVVEELTHFYTSGNQTYAAIEDISFTVEEGEFLSIIGHTGSGKSTLIQHLNGLLLPSKGRVVIDGHDMSDKKERPLGRQLVGMVFQYPEYQLFEETVAADVAYGPKNMKLDEKEVQRRVDNALRLVGLDPEVFADKSPFDLSGGEKRRAALAGIVAMEPRYLVLDEPMAGLDPQGRKQVMQMLSQLREQTGCALIMVSHSMDDVARYADRILVLNQGKLAMLAPPAEIFAEPERVAQMGISMPQSAKLAMALRQRGVEIPQVIYRTVDMLRYLEEVLQGK